MRIKDKKKLITIVLIVVVIVGAVVAVKWKDISSDTDRSEISKQEVSAHNSDNVIVQDEETPSIDNPEDYYESEEGEVSYYHSVTAEDEEIDVVSRFKAMSWDEIKKITFKEYISDWTNVVCIAEIPEKDIRVYGYNDDELNFEGVAVQIGENVHYYDWTYTSSQLILPQVYWDEERQQLQLAMHVYTGTGASADRLYVIHLQEDEMGAFVYGDYSMTQYAEDLSDMIETVYDFDSQELSFLDRKTGESLITVNKPNEKIQDVEWGYVSKFSLGEKVYFEVTPGYITDTVGLMQYEDMPSLLFEVKWDDENIGANEFELVFISAD